MRCDFCSSPDIQWAYPTRAFIERERVGIVGITYDGKVESEELDITYGDHGDGWAACAVCHALIERGDRVRLCRRSAKGHLRYNPDTRLSLGQCMKLIRPLQDKFWRERQGRPTRVQPTTEGAR